MQKLKFKDLKRAVQRNLPCAYWSYIETIATPTDEDHSSNNNSMKRFWTYIKHRKTDRGVTSSLMVFSIQINLIKQLFWTTNSSQLYHRKPTSHSQEEFVAGNFTQGTFLTCPDLNMCWYRKITEKPKPKQGCWTGQLKTRILKELGSDIAPTLCAIFKKSMESGTVPEDWRKTHITPIYKKGQRYKAENYSPV